MHIKYTCMHIYEYPPLLRSGSSRKRYRRQQQATLAPYLLLARCSSEKASFVLYYSMSQAEADLSTPHFPYFSFFPRLCLRLHFYLLWKTWESVNMQAREKFSHEPKETGCSENICLFSPLLFLRNTRRIFGSIRARDGNQCLILILWFQLFFSFSLRTFSRHISLWKGSCHFEVF